MADPSPWRSGASAEHYAAHDFADFAQEFLRRNSDYQHEWAEVTECAAATLTSATGSETELARRWGLCVPVRPDATPRQEPALWLPHQAVGVVTIEGPAGPLMFTPPGDTEVVAEHLIGDERHLVLRSGAVHLRLCLRQAPTRSVPTFVISLDANAAKRLVAVGVAERVLQGASGRLPKLPAPTPYQCRRLIQMLRLHDALQGGAAMRDIAFGLIFPRMVPLTGAAWKGSGERRHTHRLIAQVRQMIGGGYRQLLLCG
ncbi:DNA -binding domain-containing protein [Novosphingobium subterraneum]|uniref:DNA -binding domain-containing protein n=1 Tax=Novosphingobium subterraneum TaxID=48936 RepID=UPI0010F535BC